MSLVTVQIPALQDNYVYLLQDSESGKTAVIDPSEAQPVLNALRQKNWKLDFILNTHHHWDHTGGNEALKKATGCKIIGPLADAHRIPGMDAGVQEGDPFELGTQRAQIFEIHGHTLGHIAFYFREARALFCGDTLFSLGCGRLFEGTPEMMWESLTKLRHLPPETQVYCAHEYTESNAKFALHLSPKDEALLKEVTRIRELRKAGKPTIPSLMEFEQKFNPFLKAGSAENFAKLRKMKDGA